MSLIVYILWTVVLVLIAILFVVNCIHWQRVQKASMLLPFLVRKYDRMKGGAGDQVSRFGVTGIALFFVGLLIYSINREYFGF
ncbi:hypothetical protein [Streptomonospora arabica]|uniref:Uncharacterized protein n=1 Tax=Streptomonospora arabica TaxID=412417 RepID=A0ABV9SNL7_9ACTN